MPTLTVIDAEAVSADASTVDQAGRRARVVEQKLQRARAKRKRLISEELN